MKQYKVEFKLHGVIFTSDGIFSEFAPEEIAGAIKKQIQYAVDVRIFSRIVAAADRNADYKLEREL